MPDPIIETNTERVEVLPPDSASQWHPSIGDETLRLLDSLSNVPSDEKAVIQREAVDIFSRCINPHSVSSPTKNTGLVVGYVQSGKTLSFTTVSALAHDNGYRIVIIITGIKVHLTAQSTDRLMEDLGLMQSEVRPPWKHYHNPTITESQNIKGVLRDWGDPLVHEQDKKTVLITVMKHHGYLEKLKELLQAIDLNGIPTLIIDDEADQAGLNNLIKESDESSTYRRLRQLREIIPHHTFLQYTATPQGPLLINIIDVLSPDFAAVLTPGSKYVGGKDFFTDHTALIRDIPENEIATLDNRLTEPPESLLGALRIFFLGVASAYSRRENNRGNRSMMVHPSKKTIGHAQYFNWVAQVANGWLRIFDATAFNPADPDRVDLINTFRADYEDLRNTVPDLESFELLIAQLPRALQQTKIVLINSTPDSSKIVWRDDYSWILVGGDALDRGFTIEGLTITYMPRGIGVGNADTIQQRARFFGYKKDYLGYCRVFLEPRLHEAFGRYVSHEESIRERLITNINSGSSLRYLRRTFLLDRSLRPTRGPIIDIAYSHITLSDWIHPRVPHEPLTTVQENRSLVEALVPTLNLQESSGHDSRTTMQRHLVASGISLRLMYDAFLTKLQNSNLSDTQDFTGALLVLHYFLLSNPEATCTVFYMGKGARIERGLKADGTISNLFQGAYPVTPAEQVGTVYPGDREIRGPDHVTMQIRRVDIKSGTKRDDPVIVEDVPVVAIWIDPEIANDVINQNQGTE